MSIKKVIVSIIVTVTTTLIMLFLNNVVLKALSGAEFGSDPYEKQIQLSVLNTSNIKERLDSVGGLTKIKEHLVSQVLLPLKYPHLFFSKRTALTPSRGVLLCGPPGTGKTMLVKAIAAESNVPFIPVTLAAIENKYYGESAKLIKAVFAYARKVQPCIVFFDEIDGFMRARSEQDQSCVYGTKTELLTLLDGMSSEETDSFFVVGCTNVRESLDVALKRRLSTVFTVELPNEEDRVQILEILTAGKVTVIRRVASITKGFSGSDLTELYRRVCQAHFRSVLTEETLQRTKDPDELLANSIKYTFEEWEECVRDMNLERTETSATTSLIDQLVHKLGQERPTRNGDDNEVTPKIDPT